jgi:hypothetical protein
MVFGKPSMKCYFCEADAAHSYFIPIHEARSFQTRKFDCCAEHKVPEFMRLFLLIEERAQPKPRSTSFLLIGRPAAPKVVGAETLSCGVLVTFDKGRSSFFSPELLRQMLPQPEDISQPGE